MNILCLTVLGFALQLSGQKHIIEDINDVRIYPKVRNILQLKECNKVDSSLIEVYVLSDEDSISVEGSFIHFFPYRTGMSTIFLKNRDSNVVDSISLYVDDFPEPKVFVADFTNGDSISKRMLKAQLWLILRSRKGIISADYYEILSFSILALRNDRVMCSAKNIGYKFSEQTIECLNIFKEGDILLIHEILIKTPHSINLISPIEMFIK